jgi:hypothetical protein
MYGEMEYTRRLQPSSCHCHGGEHLDQPKQEGQGHFGNSELMIKLDFLIYDCVKLPVGIRSCLLVDVAIREYHQLTLLLEELLAN